MWIDSVSMSWTIDPNKISDILRETDNLVDHKNIEAVKLVKLKQLQKTVGKYGDLATLCPLIQAKASHYFFHVLLTKAPPLSADDHRQGADLL